MWEDEDTEHDFEPCVPMHLRRWKRMSRGGKEPRGSQQQGTEDVKGVETLKVVSYNVLAESLEEITTSGLDCRIACWKHRSRLIKDELKRWDADIVCLQEVDHFDDFFMKVLGKWGYEGRFLKRTGDKRDGCAIFWR